MVKFLKIPPAIAEAYPIVLIIPII